MRIIITKEGAQMLSNVKIIKVLPPKIKRCYITIESKNTTNGLRSPSSRNLKLIKLRNKKLFIPSVMQDKYSDVTLNQLPLIINNISTSLTEASLPSIKHEYKLNEILISKPSLKDINLNKGIKFENVNLISYLNQNKPNNNFLKKITKLNDDKLYKLNKIVQKYNHQEEVGNVMKSVIKKKVLWSVIRDSEYYKANLNQMKKSLHCYEHIYSKLKQKKEDYLLMRDFFLINKKLLEKHNTNN